MRTFECVALDVCGDCLIWMANGDSSGMSDEDAERIPREQVELWSPAEGWSLIAGGTCTCGAHDNSVTMDDVHDWGWTVPEEGARKGEARGLRWRIGVWHSEDCPYAQTLDGDDGWFSAARCDACRTRLAGDRYHATAMRETTA